MRAGGREPDPERGGVLLSPLRRTSTRRAREQRERRELFQRSHGPERCQWPGGCVNEAIDGDELLSRARGGSASDPDNVWLLCRGHHDWKHNHPAEAKAMGIYPSALPVVIVRHGEYDQPVARPKPTTVPCRDKSLRAKVEARDGGRCVDCPPTTPTWPPADWHADHIVPLSRGGADDLDNLATRCIPHHAIKSRVERIQRARLTWLDPRDEVGVHSPRISFRISREGLAFVEATAAEMQCTTSDVLRAMFSIAAAHPEEILAVLLAMDKRKPRRKVESLPKGLI